MTVSGSTQTRKRRPDGGRPIAARTPPPELAAVLLAWYDRHRRALPWRSGPGERPDPYSVWLSEIMLQQTTVQTAAPYYARFLERFPSLAALAAAECDAVLGAWAGLGYYARARNLHACARAVLTRHGGVFPSSEADLRALPGIGAYTAAAVAAIAFGAKATPIDGNVTRVFARLYAVSGPPLDARAGIRRHAQAATPDRRAGDFAQAVMDLGATICTPKRPACGLCPLASSCAARARGTPEAFPGKKSKSRTEERRGAAFVLLRGTDVLVRARPARGLLGGMIEVPTTPWSADFDDCEALAHAPRIMRSGARTALRWRRLAEPVTHVFSHFRLRLTVFVAAAPKGVRAPSGARFLDPAEIASAALPTLMRKVLAAAKTVPPPATRNAARRTTARHVA